MPGCAHAANLGTVACRHDAEKVCATGGLSGGAIAGIMIAVLVVVALAAILLAMMLKGRRSFGPERPPASRGGQG